MKRFNLFLISILVAFSATARPKEGHYAELDGKSGDALFAAINQCANKGYHSLGYDHLEDYYSRTDSRNGLVWDMYSNCNFTFNDANCQQKNVCDCWNKEHSIPKSWWGGSTGNQGCDIFHVVPTDARANNLRSNYPFGEVADGYKVYGTVKIGESKLSGYSGKVAEPDDEYKGDFARGYMGTLLKWKLAATQGNGSSTFSGNFTANGNYGFTAYGVSLLMSWHRLDAVSEKELERNDSIEATQGNRNPFIDYPELAEYLWGSKKGQKVVLADLKSAYEEVSYDSPTLIQPAKNSVINLSSVEVNGTTTQSFTVKGALLTSDINLTLGGQDADLFRVSPSKLTAQQANSGQQVSVIYSPTSVGEHSATLTLSSIDFTDVTLSLSAKATPEGVIPEGSGDYVRVEQDLDDWTGSYLIVYEAGSVALNAGQLSVGSNKGPKQTVTITDGKIESTAEIDKCAVAIEKSGTGYSIRTANGLYIGNDSGNNIVVDADNELLNSINYSDGVANIICNNTWLRFNTGSDGGIFRYYKSTSYSNQKPVQLYKKELKAANDESSGVENIAEKDYVLKVAEGKIMVEAATVRQLMLFDHSGKLLLSDEDNRLNIWVPSGLYLLKIGNKVEKVIVR